MYPNTKDGLNLKRPVHLYVTYTPVSKLLNTVVGLFYCEKCSIRLKNDRINLKNSFSVGNNSRSFGTIIPTVRFKLGSTIGTRAVARGKLSINVTSGSIVTPKPADTRPLIASKSFPSK